MNFNLIFGHKRKRIKPASGEEMNVLFSSLGKSSEHVLKHCKNALECIM